MEGITGGGSEPVGARFHDQGRHTDRVGCAHRLSQSSGRSVRARWDFSEKIVEWVTGHCLASLNSSILQPDFIEYRSDSIERVVQSHSNLLCDSAMDDVFELSVHAASDGTMFGIIDGE